MHRPAVLIAALFALLLASAAAAQGSSFERDRQAILAMAGDYEVGFDFRETASFDEAYEPKERYLSGAHEVVRVIEDTGHFISLQHILVVGGDGQYFPIKHWRQDWQYQPERVLVFIGGNAWKWRDVPAGERDGAWSQTVYQVDDSPRYGAVGVWSHDNGLSEWVPPAEWRPLPRRDMTKRDDYHTIDAVNRHAITPDGWVHEQDNTKIVLRGEPRALVREIGLNTYRRSNDFPVEVAEEYWEATRDYWAEVRRVWKERLAEGPRLALTEQGEPQGLYIPLLEAADAVQNEGRALAAAVADAETIIREKTVLEIPELQARLRVTETPPS